MNRVGALVLCWLSSSLNKAELGRRHRLQYTDNVSVSILEDLLAVVGILANVGGFVLEVLETLVETGGHNSSCVGCDEVDPVVRFKEAKNHIRTEATSGVKRTTSVVGTQELGKEESETNTDRGQESTTVLLSSEQKDGKNELASKEELQPEALCNVGAVGEGGTCVDVTREDTSGQSGSGDTTCELSNREVEQLEPAKGTSQEKSKSDGRVEKTTRNTIESPGVDGKRETETERREKKSVCVGRSVLRERSSISIVLGRRSSVGSFSCNTEGEEEEKNGTDEFRNESNDVVLDLESTSESSTVVVTVLVLLFVDLHETWELLFDDDALSSFEQSRLIRVAIGGRSEGEEGRLGDHLAMATLTRCDGCTSGCHCETAVLVLARCVVVAVVVAYSSARRRSGSFLLCLLSACVNSCSSSRKLWVGCWSRMEVRKTDERWRSNQFLGTGWLFALRTIYDSGKRRTY